MNRLIALPLAFLFVSCLTACGADTHAKAKSESMTIMGGIVETLADSKDVPSAEANKSKLDGLIDDLSALRTRVEALPEATAEEKAEMATLEGTDAIQAKLVAEISRISLNPAIAKVLEESIKKLEAAVK